jgi:hypothetical protein
LSLSNGSQLDMELGRTGDLVRVLGGNFFVANSPGAVSIDVIDAGLTPNQPYTLIDWTGATPIGVALSDFQLGPGSVPGTLAISGNTLTFTPVPEPGSLALLGIAAVCGWMRRRRSARN